MAGTILLDSNLVVAFFNGDAEVARRMNEADALFISTIVLGELYFGARKSAKISANVQRVDTFARRYAILDCNFATAQRYGIIKSALQTIGRPIPENDAWIAATAMQHNLTLATRDAHFRGVDGLQVEAW